MDRARQKEKISWQSSSAVMKSSGGRAIGWPHAAIAQQTRRTDEAHMRSEAVNRQKESADNTLRCSPLMPGEAAVRSEGYRHGIRAFPLARGGDGMLKRK